MGKRVIAGMVALTLLLTLAGCGISPKDSGRSISKDYPLYGVSWLTKRNDLEVTSGAWRISTLSAKTSVLSDSTGEAVYTQDLPKDFVFTSKVSFEKVIEAGSLTIRFGQDTGGNIAADLEVKVERQADGKMQISALADGKSLGSSGFCMTEDTAVTLVLDISGSDTLTLYAAGEKDFAYFGVDLPLAAEIEARLQKMALVSSLKSVQISDIGIDATPYKVGDMAEYAQVAAANLFKNFWYGDLETGAARGGFCDTGHYIMGLYTYYLRTKDPVIKTMFACFERELLQNLKRSDFTVAGTSVTLAGDDAGYLLIFYMLLYRINGNPEMLTYTRTLFDSIYDRWWDDIYGGGLWYNNLGAAGGDPLVGRTKSLYSVSTVLGAFDYYDVTQEEDVYRLAVDEYEWMATHLNERRDDGLYFADYNDQGAGCGASPDSIGHDGSSTYLGGNCGMVSTHWRMYKYTNDTKYLDRALATLNGILTKETENGRFINGRDVMTNAAMMGRLVETLIEMKEAGKDNGYLDKFAPVLFSTATVIHQNRSEDGFYNGAWYPLAEGEKSISDQAGITGDVSCVSYNSVHLIHAAALMEYYLAGGAL